MKKMSESKIRKQLERVKKQHKFIAEYAENYALIETGSHDDFNNYDFRLEDNQGNKLTLRKTVRGDQIVDVIFILKTSRGRFVNVDKTFKEKDVPVKVYCMTSEKEWKFSFNGEVINTASDDKKPLTLSFNAVFTSEEPIIDMFDSIDSKDKIEKLKASYPDQRRLSLAGIADQVSYEQQGTIKAEVKFNEETIELSSKGVRKHNFGKMNIQNFLKFINIA